jgi:uncharacterized membrane protein YfcA
MVALALVALAVAVLSGLGVGSAGLLVVYLSLVMELPQLTAQGLNLFFFLFASGAALCLHLTRTPLLYGCLILLLLGGLPTAFFATRLAVFLPQELLRRLFGAFLIGSGILGLFKRRS